MWRAQGIKRQREEEEDLQKEKRGETKAHPPNRRQAPTRPAAIGESKHWMQPQGRTAAHTN